MDDDNKVSVEEALNKLYDLSWMVGSFVFLKPL